MLLPTLHYLHVLLAVGWAGATLAFGLIVWPRLAQMPIDQARMEFDLLKRPVAVGLGSVAGFTYLLGLARAWIGGGMSGWGDLLAPYGVVVSAAVITMMAIEHTGGRLRRNLHSWLSAPEDFAAKAPSAARRAGLIQLMLMALVVGLMVAMGLGFV